MIKTFTSFLFAFPLLAMSQTWETSPAMPAGKHHPVTFAIDGKGYAVTGTETISQFYTDDVYRFNPETDQWSSLPAFPGGARSFAIGQAYNGKGYLGFGRNASSFLNDIWEFDPVTESWSLLTTCTCSGRRHPAFIIRDDKIYVGLGDGASGDLGDWFIYDMNTDTWTQGDNLPSLGRHHPFMFPAGDHIYAGMGHRGQIIFDDWFMFDITTDTWVAMADFPGEARVAGTQFGHQDKGYVLSGDGDNHSFMPTGEFWEYDPTTDDWTQLDPHPGISRWAPGSFVIDGAVYLLGGQNRQTGNIENSVWKYQLTPSDSSVTSVDERLSYSDVSIYPNPATNVVFVRSQERVSSIQVYSLSGTLIAEIKNSNEVQLSGVESGVYFMRAMLESGHLHEERLIVR